MNEKRTHIKVAFVAMPYNAATDWERGQNIQSAACVAGYLWAYGFAVICPHTNSAHFGGAAPERNFYDGYLELVRRSDVIVAGPGWENSTGACGEVQLGLDLGKELLEFTRTGGLEILTVSG